MDENGGGGGEIDDKLFQSRHLQRTKFVLTKILGQKRKRRRKREREREQITGMWCYNYFSNQSS